MTDSKTKERIKVYVLLLLHTLLYIMRYLTLWTGSAVLWKSFTSSGTADTFWLHAH